MISALKLQVVMSEEEPQPEFVHGETPGEGEGFAHQAADALPGGAEETLGVGDFTAGFGAKPVGAPRKRSLIRKATRRCAWGGRGNPAAEKGAASAHFPFRAVAFAWRRRSGGCAGTRRSRASTRALLLAADEAPELIALQHVAFLGGQECFVQPGKRRRLFFPPSVAACDNRDRRYERRRARRAARRWRHGRSARAL